MIALSADCTFNTGQKEVCCPFFLLDVIKDLGGTKNIVIRQGNNMSGQSRPVTVSNKN